MYDHNQIEDAIRLVVEHGVEFARVETAFDQVVFASLLQYYRADCDDLCLIIPAEMLHDFYEPQWYMLFKPCCQYKHLLAGYVGKLAGVDMYSDSNRLSSQLLIPNNRVYLAKVHNFPKLEIKDSVYATVNA